MKVGCINQSRIQFTVHIKESTRPKPGRWIWPDPGKIGLRPNARFEKGVEYL